MRRFAVLSILLAWAIPTAAQAPPPAVSRWFGRLAFGWTRQDPYAYRIVGWGMGGTAGYMVGDRLGVRVDLWKRSFGARIDNSICNGISPITGDCIGQLLAPDREDEWSVCGGVEWRPEAEGFYAVGGVAAVHRTGIALGRAGFSVGPMVGLGMRVGRYVALEARFVQLLGAASQREAWTVPMAVLIGP
jgi:hypothetical protein